MVDEHVDYRFLLANERTFLAYIRTALALQLAGLAVLQFLTHGHQGLRLALGVLPASVCAVRVVDPEPRRRIVAHVRDDTDTNPAVCRALEILHDTAAAER